MRLGLGHGDDALTGLLTFAPDSTELKELKRDGGDQIEPTDADEESDSVSVRAVKMSGYLRDDNRHEEVQKHTSVFVVRLGIRYND